MNSTILIIGIVLLVIGLILLIIGIVIHQNNVQNNQGVQPWWVWFLIIGGIIVAIIGGVMMAFSATRKSAPPPIRYVPAPQPQYAQPAPCWQPPKPCPTPCPPASAPMYQQQPQTQLIYSPNPNAVTVPTQGMLSQQALQVPPAIYPASGYASDI